MHVISVCTDLEKYHLIPICDLHTNCLENFIHFRGEYRSSILRGADEMVEQDRYIVAPVNMFTHASEYITQKARQAAGNVPLWIQPVKKGERGCLKNSERVNANETLPASI